MLTFNIWVSFFWDKVALTKFVSRCHMVWDLICGTLWFYKSRTEKVTASRKSSILPNWCCLLFITVLSDPPCSKYYSKGASNYLSKNNSNYFSLIIANFLNRQKELNATYCQKLLVSLSYLQIKERYNCSLTFFICMKNLTHNNFVQ